MTKATTTSSSWVELHQSSLLKIESPWAHVYQPAGTQHLKERFWSAGRYCSWCLLHRSVFSREALQTGRLESKVARLSEWIKNICQLFLTTCLKKCAARGESTDHLPLQTGIKKISESGFCKKAIQPYIILEQLSSWKCFRKQNLLFWKTQTVRLQG